MTDKKAKLAAVAAFSERYRAEYMDEPAVNLNRTDDPFRLRFLLKRAFASARSESVSTAYRRYTEQVLKEHQSAIEERVRGSETGIEDDALLQALESAGVGNGRDRRMVLEILDYVSGMDGSDVIEYTKRSIRDGRLPEVFEELRDIYNVGPKKATLFLRDVVSHWDLEDNVEGHEYRYLIPIDTWVFKICDAIGILTTESPRWDTNSQEIVEACGDEVSPLALDQGAWYLGANSFDVLIRKLDNLNPKANP